MNDNAETVLLNLARGTGLRGLCGIPPRRDNIIRPLLNLSRSEIEAWLREKGISYCEDSTNASDLYARNRARHHVLPAFESLHPQAVQSICRASVSLREDEEYLSSLAEAFLLQHGRDKLPSDKLLDLPRPVARRVLRLWLGTELSFERTEALLQLCSSSSGSIAEYPGGAVEHSFGFLLPHRPEITLPVRVISENCEISLPEIQTTLRCRRLSDSTEIQISFNTFCFSCGSIHGILCVTSRRAGDAMHFLRGNGTTSIKKKMSEKKIPSSLRSLIPVIRDDAGPLAVFGLGQSDRARAVPGEDFYKIDFIPWEEKSI